MEHISDPRKALRKIYDALRPGGVTVHNYQSFFCETGAHFDTLDFPWGHVRLSSEDFRRYISQFRTDEAEVAEWRFFDTLNRMTVADVKEYVESAGLELIDFVTLTSPDIMSLDADILPQSRQNYPNVVIADLLGKNNWLIARKP